MSDLDTRSKDQVDQSSALQSFVQTLLVTGVQPITSPYGLEDRIFFLTCRKIGNPHASAPVDKARFSELGTWANGFTEAYIIDLFEEKPVGSKNFIPFGHRDVRIARFDNEVRASGNIAVSRHYTQYSEMALPEEFARATADADKIWGMNGVDVLDSEFNSNQDIDTVEVARLRNEKGFANNQSWRGLGFGQLLVAVEIELLKQRGVQKLDLPSVSDELKTIFDKIGLLVGGTVEINTIDPKQYHKLVKPFFSK